MKRMLVLAVRVNCVAEALTDPVEIGVAVPVASVAVGYSLRLKDLSLQVGHKARQSTNFIKSDEFKYWVGAEPLKDIDGDH